METLKAHNQRHLLKGNGFGYEIRDNSMWRNGQRSKSKRYKKNDAS